MKKNLLLTLLIISAQLPMASAQEYVNAFFITTEMPDIVKFLPPPPDSLCPLYAYDVQRYAWGKSQRQNKWRADIAIRDAVYGLNTIISEFSEPFGLQISKDSTPVIYRLLEESLATTDSICTIPKRFYMRKRPFMVYHEPTLTPKFEASLSKNGSYPSGHAILGWSAALLLSEINPERADTLLSRGYMYGESRVIVGAHWQSDVDVGMLAASAAVSKLHTSPRFLSLMERAKREFNRLSAKGSAASDDTTLEDEDGCQLSHVSVPGSMLFLAQWNLPFSSRLASAGRRSV